MPSNFANEVRYVCEFCGRTWVAPTKSHSHSRGWTGFLASNVYQHKSICATRTPAERVKAAQLDAARWAKRPNKHAKVTDNFNHSGMRV